jgi:hypothetical protein
LIQSRWNLIVVRFAETKGIERNPQGGIAISIIGKSELMIGHVTVEGMIRKDRRDMTGIAAMRGDSMRGVMIADTRGDMMKGVMIADMAGDSMRIVRIADMTGGTMRVVMIADTRGDMMKAVMIADIAIGHPNRGGVNTGNTTIPNPRDMMIEIGMIPAPEGDTRNLFPQNLDVTIHWGSRKGARDGGTCSMY